MTDQDFSKLFGDFDPPMKSDTEFMSKLERRLDDVEFVKEYADGLRRRNRHSLLLAALAGFLAGVIGTLLFPTISAYLSRMCANIPVIVLKAGLQPQAIATALSWTLISLATLAVSVSVYSASASLSFSPSEHHNE